MKKLFIYIVCSAGVALSGCAFTNPERTHQYATGGIEAIDRNTEANLGIANADPDLDPVKVAMAVNTFKEAKESFRVSFEKIGKQIEEEKRQREAIVSALASLAIESLPAGSPVLKVVKALGGKIDKTAEDALTAANAETERVKKIADENKGTISKVKATADKNESAIVALMKSTNSNDKDLVSAKEKFDALNTAIQEKLSKASESVIVDLTKLKADNAAFRERYQRELELNDAEMESLKGLSTKELLALLAAAGAATGAGGALAKTGKSREHAAITELQRRLDLAEEPRTKGNIS